MPMSKHCLGLRLEFAELGVLHTVLNLFIDKISNSMERASPSGSVKMA